MTEQELASFLQVHGWSLKFKRHYQTRYAHAQRRDGGRVLTRYLASERKLADLSSEEVLRRIQKS